MIDQIFDGTWDGKIRLGDVPELLYIFIAFIVGWLFDKLENFLSITLFQIYYDKKKER